MPEKVVPKATAATCVRQSQFKPSLFQNRQ
jgi:hypothetical protein